GPSCQGVVGGGRTGRTDLVPSLSHLRRRQRAVLPDLGCGCVPASDEDLVPQLRRSGL
ncbi:MAG: hypothetical protein AVDCRST_MAG75-1528, partial [uncultured Propionibacteriaceae bacterium]